MCNTGTSVLFLQTIAQYEQSEFSGQDGCRLGPPLPVTSNCTWLKGGAEVKVSVESLFSGWGSAAAGEKVTT